MSSFLDNWEDISKVQTQDSGGHFARTQLCERIRLKLKFGGHFTKCQQAGNYRLSVSSREYIQRKES